MDHEAVSSLWHFLRNPLIPLGADRVVRNANGVENIQIQVYFQSEKTGSTPVGSAIDFVESFGCLSRHLALV